MVSMNILRPMRLKQRHADFYRIPELVPPNKILFAYELLANQLIASERPEIRDIVMSESLEHPIGAIHGEAVAVFGFRVAGRNAFVLSDDVLEALARTGLGDVRISDIALPYEAFFVAFETPQNLNNTLLCEGAYILRGGDDSFLVRLALVAPRATWPEWLPDPGFSISFSDAGTLEEGILSAIARMKECSRLIAADPWHFVSPDFGYLRDDPSKKLLPSKPTSERYLELLDRCGNAVSRLLALTLSALCLLTSVPDEMVKANYTWPQPRQNRPGSSHKTQKGALPVRYISFGSKEPAGGAAGGVGASPRAHWRRGHWRRQPYGPAADKVYRPKWIRPVLVNPDCGPVAETTIYKVSQ
ncbi:MAG: hypothetical protein ACK4GW_13545 [Pseudorhodobacter sp.]